MTIDPKTLPDGTVVESASGEHVRYVNGDALVANRKHVGIPDLGLSFPVGRVFVPVPDGVAYDDALRAVQDARPWVPLPDGPTEAHVGKRLRLETDPAIGATITDRIVGIRRTGEVTFAACGNNWYASSGDWFIHPDDVPDPDVDLIERMAAAFLEGDPDREVEWGDVFETTRERFRTAARAALAVIREDGAR